MQMPPPPDLAAAPKTPPEEDAGAAARNGASVHLARAPLIIEPSHGWRSVNLRELWRYREILYFLIWRDVKVRYKQTVLGVAWAILQPLLTMVVFTIFFGKLAGIDQRTGGLPYPVFVFAGLLPWTFFASSLTNGSQSIITSQNLITKVYFPRLLVPLSAIGAGLVDFLIAFGILLAMMLWYGVVPGPSVLLLPLIVGFILLAATAAGALLAALTVAYRDFRYVVPFLVQIWMFITPVIYPTTLVPGRWRWVLALNPMAGLIEAFRYCLLGEAMDWPLDAFLISAAVTLGVLAASLAYFRRIERRFADIV
jgi:lipopolysaccharide transport system permease protein